MLHARQMRERAELRGDRDVVVRLGNHRGLAGEGVAHQRELVARSHQERKEAVEVLEGAVERGLEAVPLLETPVDVAARALGVAVTFETHAHPLQLAAEHAGIREGAVVHEAPVLSRGVRMCILRRYCRFGRHARVAHEMRAGHRAECIPFGHIRWQPNVFVEIDGAADTQHVHSGVVDGEPASYRGWR